MVGKFEIWIRRETDTGTAFEEKVDPLILTTTDFDFYKFYDFLNYLNTYPDEFHRIEMIQKMMEWSNKKYEEHWFNFWEKELNKRLESKKEDEYKAVIETLLDIYDQNITSVREYLIKHNKDEILTYLDDKYIDIF